jgi:hypothetical protein
MAEDADRPLLIAIIAVLNLLSGILLIVGGVIIALGVVAVSDGDIDVGLAGSALGAFVALIGVLSLVIGYGFWQGWKFIWYLALIIWIIEIIGGILMFPIGLLWTIIYVILVCYLFKPNVKAFFGI